MSRILSDEFERMAVDGEFSPTIDVVDNRSSRSSRRLTGERDGRVGSRRVVVIIVFIGGL